MTGGKKNGINFISINYTFVPLREVIELALFKNVNYHKYSLF